MTQLKEKYQKEVAPMLMEKFHYSSIMEVPRIEKIILNIGVSEAVIDRKFVDESLKDLEKIAGQKPVKTKAKQSINQFKVRKGQELGVKVTLRKQKMWEFLYKLINVALPRIRDFKGIAVRGFDGKGNFTLGVREHTIFPEIEFESTEKVRGLSVTIVTTAESDAECKELLAGLGIPFRR
ncbi:MAG: 50S ribosomal protein L5 [Spirochaetes bacterium]|jgi:large subunit ribosomal protein L5|nr:50S ribosomal protein L5 [Spirochaetota bacterium]NLJ04550.1 50S ribosomal protein L5 [Exilispira sp.]MBP8990828.1 50S ribosomal protein L5 [Spirochaetota bacterium]HOV45597.1 50S ribosomal protein L5 [Exilispira sp.]HQM88685.1 50S ribosomal protein L5 [Exilispira sp.]